MKTLTKIGLSVIIVVLLLLFVKSCKKDDTKVIIKTKIEYIDRVDTITNTIIKKVPEKVFIDRYKTIKGRDSIIYRDKETNTTIKANRYETELKSNNATADLKITTTGELLDVQGVIKYQEKTTTIEKVIKKSKSGLFLYTETSINPIGENIEVGFDYVIKNKIVIGTSVDYNNVTNNISFNAKLGFRLF